jgi:hypothetical protein
VSDPKVHDQIKAAAEYARKHGMAIVMDLDVRLARSAFFAKYPEEMQEFVRLRDVALKDSGEASIAVEPISFSEHYTYAARPYETISARILKVYSYLNSPNGIAAVRDITRRCKVTETSEKGMLVTIPCKTEDRGRSACVVASFTVFTPDVFAPHLPDFERSILRQYADVPLGGACKDEWGFPARFGARTDEFFFSRPMADAYAKRRRGHNLTRDLLLMSKGEKGREPDRIAAINHYMEMNRLRNGELENSYYDGVKEVFGPTSMAATHPTWLAIPCADEAFKNGLDWWTVKKDLAQTDEQAPFCVRTSLAKKWQSPLWYNMIYARTMKSYEKSIWGYALAGGRMNIHAFYPWPEQGPEDLPGFLAKGQRDFLVAAQKLFRADCRIRLLNYISTAPLDCPVAVVFGHPRACNWASTGLGDCGLAVSDALWKDGYYADLIPSSEIGNKSLQLAEDGFIQYGPQKYAAVVLYEPQFERPEVAEFFRKAAAGKTSLFCVGDWTTDFEGREFNGDASLPSKMKRVDSSTAASQIIDVLKAKKIGPQTACESSPVEYAPTVMPKPDGQCRLLDGTRILVSATNDVLGDPIQKTIRIADQSVTFDSIGVAAVRLDKTGKLEAMAAGGLKSFEMDGLQIARCFAGLGWPHARCPAGRHR